jgi:hypothetical protein
LQADANAQEGNTGRDFFAQRLAQAKLIDSLHHLAEVAHAWENEFGGAEHYGGLVRDFVLRTEFGQRVLDRTNIARAVVDNRGHSNPLVDGN